MDEKKLEKLLALLEKIDEKKLDELLEDKPSPPKKKKRGRPRKVKKEVEEEEDEGEIEVRTREVGKKERPQFANVSNFPTGPRPNKFEELAKNPRFSRLVQSEEQDFDNKIKEAAKRIKRG